MMKRNRVIFPVLFFFVFSIFFVANAYVHAQKKPKDTFDFPKLNEIKIPKIKTVTLTNGFKLFLVEDHQYPTIDMRVLVHTGSVFESEDKIGLASLTGMVLRTGGTKTMPGDEIDTLLENMGATVETNIGRDSGYVYVSMLKETVDKVLPVFADILRNPVFNEDKITLAKTQQKTIISRRNDDIAQISSREFRKLIYGAQSPYARHPEYATLDAVTRDDLIAFHKTYFHPNNTIMAVWGDFKTSQMIKKIKKAFGTWEPVPVKVPPFPAVNYDYNYSVNFIHKTDVNQSHILIGHIGGLQDNPDMPALQVMNSILSFDRMFKKIRTDEGLSYSVWGNYGAGFKSPGVFSAGAQTKSETTVKAVKLMLNEMKRITKEEITDKELKRAKDQFLNSFVFNFESKSRIIFRMMTYAYYGYPLDFADQMIRKIENVTKADVLRVAKKYLKPDKVRILVVGKKENFDKPLSELGDVNVIDITIPVPRGEAGPKATTASLKKGKIIFEKVIAAMGPPGKIKNLKNASYKLDLIQVSPMGEMKMEAEGVIQYPDKSKFSINTPQGQVIIIIAGGKGWMKIQGNTMPMPEVQRKAQSDDILRDPFYVYQNLDKYNVQMIGEKRFNGTNVFDLLITGPSQFHLFIDPKTYLPYGASYQQVTQTGPSEIEEFVSDYQGVDGIKLPFKSIKKANGKKAGEVIVKEVKFNITVDKDFFKAE
ncbi:MAG: insulinase family protein [Candidatus Aminicenantes bacterium]|nr:MAG: insulinase family protein [Candidatus Aminicenantes bacterium]